MNLVVQEITHDRAARGIVTPGFADGSLWYKRIERGRLRLPADVELRSQVVLDSGQLLLLIEGIDWSRVRRLPDWRRNSTIDKAASV